MNMFDLTGKVALVAGGSGYLGTPVSVALAEHGAAVVVASRNMDRVNAAVAKARAARKDARVLGLTLDMAEESSILNAVAETVKQFGRLDILVNATYTSIGKRVDELTGAEFDRANHAHITGSFLLARAAADRMKDGGSIIIYSSMYGIVAPDMAMYERPTNPNPIEYGVAKAGLCQMARYLAGAYGPRRIRVNAIAPGAFTDPKAPHASPAFIKRQCAKIMLGRVGHAEETAGAVVFLASDASTYVTGETLRVDGGWTAM